MSNKQSIQTIRAALFETPEVSSDYLAELALDERKGVQQLLSRYHKQLEKLAALKEKAESMWSFERKALAQGYQSIAGIDEVGRGPLAGPVVAAAVILPVDFELLEVNDSKQLSAEKRDFLFAEIMTRATAVGVGIIPEAVIDEINIYQATKRAMESAVSQLSVAADYLLLDAMTLEKINLPQENIIKGDTKSISIAAASIVAKVIRDRMMADYAEQYPGYGFEKNAGYGTKAHLLGLEKQGPCPIHRKTFAPVKDFY